MLPAVSRSRVGFLAACAVLGVAGLRGAALADTERALLAGRYEQVITEVRDGGGGSNDAAGLLVRACLALGRNAEAAAAIDQALAHNPVSIRLLWLAREVAMAGGDTTKAAHRLADIRRLVSMRPWNYRNPEDLVCFGRAALLLGADPKDVLDRLYREAQKSMPTLRDVYLARGELALEKHDLALAAAAFEEGLGQHPDDPDLLHGKARAYANSDRETATAAATAALKANPRHVPSLLYLADQHIDAEQYADADRVLERIVGINPAEPSAWAYRAVLAHLRNQPEMERFARQKALGTWASNPAVDVLIGRKLAQKYRFAEAADAQRRALEMEPGNLAATAELATNLLRLGNGEGWELAQTVHTRDPYDVEAYNLVTLRDTISGYATLTDPHFVVRMSAQEVAVYGPRVMALLRRARETLVRKYGAELQSPTYVEIFADQKDFAVRTFGLPDVAGFLGVCFGRVVTANSPAAVTTPVNWESVLWHEFCHVVTLQMTRNRMPRWLSEGISVHEERQAAPSWGMGLTPRFREMILGDDLVPVGKLSGAFLQPKTAEHLHFAYAQSALVVEYLVARFGQESLKKVLANLREGVDINAALARHTQPLPQLEEAFAAYARDRARQVGGRLDWAKPEPALLMPGAEERLAKWEAQHPDNYWLLRLRATQAVDQQRWADARIPLQRVVELYPEQKGDDSAYPELVAVLHALGDVGAERSVLEKWAAIDDEAPDAYVRLMQLGADAGDWETVRRNAERYLSVNPLAAAPYRYLAKACAGTRDISGGIVAWRTLLQLDPADPADAHFQLARLLHQRGNNEEARRHVLLALEETPRFREALALLLELHRSTPAGAERVPADSTREAEEPRT